MFFDNTYALGQVFQAFLKDQPDILDDLRDAICGEDSVITDASDEFTGRFEQWLEERGEVTDVSHRMMLMQVAEAFADLVAAPEDAESLTLA